MRSKSPAKISEDFKPEHSLYGWATREGVPFAFIDGLINSFVYYWFRQGTRRKDWDLTFMNHVKAKWGYKLAEEKKTKTRCSVPFREMEKIEKSTSTMSLRERLRK